MNDQRDIAGIRRNWPDYEVEEVLGHGSYGRVYKIKRDYLGSRTFSALKVIHIPPSDDMRNELESQGASFKDAVCMLQKMLSYSEEDAAEAVRKYW